MPILTDEKLELPAEFLPFVANSAVDMIQLDIAFAGGFTGCWKTADLSEMYYVPVTAHNVGNVAQNVATAHFAASTLDFDERGAAAPWADPSGPHRGVTKHQRRHTQGPRWPGSWYPRERASAENAPGQASALVGLSSDHTVSPEMTIETKQHGPV